MIHLKKTWLSLIATSCLCLSHIALSANQIWQGKSSGLNIHWTEADITAFQNGKRVFSAKSDLTKYDTNYPTCGDQDKRTLTLLSVVGHIASIKDVTHYHCQNIDGNDPRIIAIDLASGKPVSLTDFFPESAILKALLADSAIKKVLSNQTRPPATLKTLFQALDDELTHTAITALDEDGSECQFSIETKYFLTQFAFHHINRDQVAVRLALTPAAQHCQWRLPQIGIYLPIPKTLQAALKQAKKGKAGFLMNKQQKIAKGRETIWDDIYADTITVQRGDTLYSIARHSKQSIADIAAWNDLIPPYQLSLGQTLLISPPVLEDEKDEVVEEKHHTVVPGETLFRIARHYGLRVADIVAWNKLQKPYNLSVGQKLQVSEPSSPKESSPKYLWTQKGIIHSTLPEFTFKLVGEGAKRVSEGSTVEAIEVHRGNQSKPVQIISIDDGPPAFDDLSNLFIIEDVNFDGYQDIRLYSGVPAYNNVNFTYWLFEPQTAHFVGSEAFNTAGLDLPTFSAKTKEIFSKWTAGAFFHGTNYHKVINGQPVWILQESFDVGIRTQMYMGDETMEEIVYQDIRMCSEEDPSSSYASEIIYCSKKVKKRIITAYRVNARSAPTRSAKVIKQLPIGTVVYEVARSETQEKIGQSQDYWYQIKMAKYTEETVWVFGSLSMPFESPQNYLEIAQAQMQKKLNLRDQMALTDFFARIKDKIESAEIAAEMGLLHLSSLQKSINPTDKDEASYRAWFDKQKDLVYYDIEKEKWFVKSEAFWKWHEKYYPLPITERIAWAGTKNFFAERHLSECGYFFCQIQRIYNTTAQYLKFHPNGEHKGEALEEIAHFLSSYINKYEEKGNVVITIKGVESLKLLAVIGAIVERTSHPKQAEVLRLIDRLACGS